MTLHNSNYAIYLPAVNASYLATVAKPLPQGRRFPSGLTLQDLMFWEPNKLWHYPNVLHSIGQYAVGNAPHVAMNKVNRAKSILVGDSGGYQIGKGTLKGLQHVKNTPMKADAAVSAWRKESIARKWIADWLGSECDYAMTIDMPLWVMDQKGHKSPFHNCTTEQLIAMSVQNLRYIEAYSPEHVKWLNVIQGSSSVVDAIAWWNAVKWFRKGGWAMAGAAGMAGGLYNMLSVLFKMRDDDAFVAGQDWLHVLGVSTPFWSIALSAVQEGLRNTNPKLTVSFDSSSPFLLGGRYEEVALTPTFGTAPSSWSIKTVSSPQLPSYAKSTYAERFPYQQSPLGKVLLLNELCVQEGNWQPRSYDAISNALLTNHNIWVYLDAFMKANEIVETRNLSCIPSDYMTCVDLIKHLFTMNTGWHHELDSNKKLLDKLAPENF